MESKTQRGMRNGTCPNCGSTEVYAGTDVNVKKGRYNVIPIALLIEAALDNYVCAECGYVEHYVADRAKLEKIKAKWQKVKQK
ncbi:MAG: hypothetical protein AMXMBFR60_05030 [Chloroflexota bacterium]|nr:hypothetical protein [Anaerolineales bacterium]